MSDIKMANGNTITIKDNGGEKFMGDIHTEQIITYNMDIEQEDREIYREIFKKQEGIIFDPDEVSTNEAMAYILFLEERVFKLSQMYCLMEKDLEDACDRANEPCSCCENREDN
jgi:hypothetical protein